MSQVNIQEARTRETTFDYGVYSPYLLDDRIWVLNKSQSFPVLEFENGLSSLYLGNSLSYPIRNVGLYLSPYSNSLDDWNSLQLLLDIGTRYSGYGVSLLQNTNSDSVYESFNGDSGSSVINPKSLRINSGVIYPGQVIKVFLKFILPTQYPIEKNLMFGLEAIFEGELNG